MSRHHLWIAALLSNFGVWIQSVAAAWLMTWKPPSQKAQVAATHSPPRKDA